MWTAHTELTVAFFSTALQSEAAALAGTHAADRLSSELQKLRPPCRRGAERLRREVQALADAAFASV